MNVRRITSAVAFSLAALALAAPAASAHPLGNFTINHYNGLRVEHDRVIVDHVTDFAEVPAFGERRAIDSDGDGSVSDAEAATAARERCASLTEELSMRVQETTLPLTLTHAGLSFPMGQGAPTMRLVCVYVAPLPAPLASATEFDFSDTSYAERQGWREITVAGDGATIAGTDTASESSSARLTDYPGDLLSIPLGQSTASFTASVGGPRLAPFEVPDAGPVDSDEPADAPAAPDSAAAPAGVSELGAGVTALFQAPELTPAVMVLSLLVAFALGALHALSPGHGKTVMAAYLVGSQGTLRQAVGLGLTVTVSHTLGVLALGVLTLSAALVLPAERLYPILSVVSGAIVVVIGAYLLIARARTLRGHAHRHDAHEHEHEHEHSHPHEHARPPGWHEHDGMGHTHLPQPSMGRRGLFALGLSGGMIPSISALLVLIGSISIGRPAWGIVLTVAFGVGMAVVLVGIGLALVYARRLVERLPQAAPLRIGQRLPLASAFVVLAAGVLITGQGLVALG